MKVIETENLGKKYRLGVINRGMLYKDIQSWWAKLRGHEDPNAPLLSMGSHGQRNANDFWAFRNVSFSVNPGEIVGVIGRNGAGKSTLLKVLSQITAPTEGSIRLRGRAASLLEVGTGFHGELTGRENIYLNGAILGMSRMEVKSKLDEIVSFAEVEQFLDTPVKRYSSGMYVRLAFSVAAHLEPDILMVDEVLAVGDAAFREKCLTKMDDVAKHHGRAVLFVSHNMEAVRSLCSRGILLQWGELIADGPIDSVLQRYLKSDDSLSDEAFGDNRAGSGRLRMTDLTLRNETGQPMEVVPAGGSVTFEISYKQTGLMSNELFSLGFSLHTATADVLSNYSHFNGTEFLGDNKSGVIRMTWPSVDMVPGRYFIGFVATVRNGPHFGELLDKSGTIVFEVVPSEYYRKNVRVTDGLGVLLIKSSWELEACPK
ncbi:MAG: polysaccharide ABC transporter ATP-binding protein [Chthoniobacterales bacterium]